MVHRLTPTPTTTDSQTGDKKTCKAYKPRTLLPPPPPPTPPPPPPPLVPISQSLSFRSPTIITPYFMFEHPLFFLFFVFILFYFIILVFLTYFMIIIFTFPVLSGLCVYRSPAVGEAPLPLFNVQSCGTGLVCLNG